MQRRNFIKNLSMAGASLSLMSFRNKEFTSERKNVIIKPKALKKGDTIGLITPGSFIPDEGLEKAVNNIKSLGFKVKLAQNIRAKRGYTAGTVQQRLDDLHEMFENKKIDGIWTARGGYGCTGLLPHIDYELIKNNPKVFIGYSDITALHLAIYKKTGLVTFHGPVASSNLTDYTVKYLKEMITVAEIPPKVIPCRLNDDKSGDNKFFKAQTLVKGESVGRLIGGNLSLIASMAGTEWEINFDNKLLFIEDIGEAPYRIDRMLIQLDQNRDLNDARGIVFGVFDDSDKPEDELSLELEETFKDNCADLEIPAAYGFSFGHIDNQFTIPYGIKARMNAENRTIEFLESAVI